MDDVHNWVSSFLGIDPRQTLTDAAATATPANGGSATPASGAAPAAPPESLMGKVGDWVSHKLGDGKPLHLKKSFDYTVKKIPLLGGKVSVKGNLTCDVEGDVSIDDENKTQIDAQSVVFEYGRKWVSGEADKSIEGSDLFHNIKMEGLEISGSEPTRFGQFTLSITLAGIDKEKQDDKVRVLPSFLQGKASLAAVGVAIPGDDAELSGLKVANLNAKLGGEVTLGPDTAAILKDWLLKQFENRAVDAGKSWAEKAGQAALEGITLDAIISASFVAGGVAAIVGSIRGIIMADEYQDLGDGIAKSNRAAAAGWLGGACGDQPPGDPLGAKHYDAGKQVHDKAFQDIKTQRPEAQDADIAQFIATQARQMWSDGLPYGTGMQIDKEIRASFWASYLAAHKNSFLTAEEAKMAYQICFTDSAQVEGTKAWSDYLADHKIGAHL